MENNKFVFALAGNPNCGKTTLFNSLTGSTAYVGNWPGVTVEKREGTYKNKDLGEAKIVDLPGIYSLSPYTPEEIISRNYILNEKPDCVINVLDATNLERNLYMTTQILEMNVPVVIALNMMDAVKANGQTINCEELSKKLGVPVIPISALRYDNLDELMKNAMSAASLKREGCSVWNTGSEKENIAKACKVYEDANCENALFHAIKALEGDELEEKDNKLAYDAVKALGVDKDDFEATSADLRYKYITGSLSSCRTGVVAQESKKLSLSDKIDKVLTNKWAAIPIMIVVLFLIFHFTFGSDLFFLGKMGVNYGDGYPGFISWTTNFSIDEEAENPNLFTPFAELFYSSEGINSIGSFLANLWGSGNDAGIQGMICIGIKQGLIALNSPEWLVSFIYDGVLGGVSAVLGFVPQILVLFFFFSILEDSGYMARIAFVLDRIFRRFGVSGRAFLPMIMGFGCGVPAMINTRTLASDKERIKTIRVIPFFTCGAKAEFLAVIAAAVATLVGLPADLFTFIIYVLGMVIAIAMVILMNNTTQREKVPPFIMELPSYHMPQPHALMMHVWDRGKHYIKKAFTIIFASTVIIWFLSNFTPSWQFIPSAAEELGLTDADSILAHIGMIIAPIFTPMGFGSLQGGSVAWTYAVASIQGIVAKENVVAILESLSSLDTVQTLAGGAEGFEAIVAASNASKVGTYGIDAASLTAFTVFNMTTIPCFASVATAKGELGNGKAYKGTLVFWLLGSYILGCITYVCLEWLWTMAIIIPVIVVIFVLAFLYNRKMNDKEAKLNEVTA